MCSCPLAILIATPMKVVGEAYGNGRLSVSVMCVGGEVLQGSNGSVGLVESGNPFGYRARVVGSWSRVSSVVSRHIARGPGGVPRWPWSFGGGYSGATDWCWCQVLSRKRRQEVVGSPFDDGRDFLEIGRMGRSPHA